MLGDGTREIYLPTGRILKRIDPVENGLTFSYDERGQRLTAVSDSAGRRLQVGSTGSGLIHTVTDPAGRRITYRYDANDNLIGVTDFAGSLTQFSYDAAHH
jgi:YD repeat-containing protein